ncbi:M48 family metalloprotease [Sphingomonas arantia]
MVAGPVAASPAQDAMFARLRGLDRRVAVVAERLLIANATLCRRTQPAFGMVLHAIDQYPPAMRARARAAFGFVAPVAVEAVVPGAAAERGGARDDDGVVAIAGVPVAVESGTAVGTRTRDAVLDRLANVPPGAPIVLTLLRDGIAREVRLVPPAACAARVELSTDRGTNAVADEATILVGSDLVERIADDGLAVVLAHELAHVVLGHRRRLAAAGVRRGVGGAFGRSRRLTRATEDEADRMSAYLLANAGYDAGMAAAFWRTAGAGLAGSFRSRTHGAASARAQLLAEEAAVIAVMPGRPVRPALLGRRDVPLR